jgi:hypothetical protein
MVQAGGTSQVVTMPTGVQRGDLILVSFGMNGVVGSTWTPPGSESWTLEDLNTVNSEILRTYSRKSDGTETGTRTWTTSTSMDGGGGAIAFRGADLTTPVLAAADAGDGGNTTSHTAPSASWGGSASAISVIVGTWQTGSATVTWPMGWTEAWNRDDTFEASVLAYNLTTNIAVTSLPSKTVTTSASRFGEWSQLAVQVLVRGQVSYAYSSN